jgi:glutamine amidotransferase-like uncharacterized protein
LIATGLSTGTHSAWGAPHELALYDGSGTWWPGIKHLKTFLKEKKMPYRVVSAHDIKNGVLEREQFHTIIIPGGKSWEYLREVGPEGAEAIRQFVHAGGGYLGICAGGFFATTRREGPRPEGQTADSKVETAIYPYGIGLLDATAVDGANITRYKDEFRDGVRRFEFLPTNAQLAGRTIASLQPLKTMSILLLEGSGWRIPYKTIQDQKVNVIAQTSESHLPVMMTFQYGKGKAFVTGPHIEVEEKRSILGLVYHDPDSEWPILESALQFVRRNSSLSDEEFHQTALSH